jgi:hypothetical protein
LDLLRATFPSVACQTPSFSLQIYTADELKTMLARNGFETIHQYDMEGNDFIAEKSLNILTVARKKDV